MKKSYEFFMEFLCIMSLYSKRITMYSDYVTIKESEIINKIMILRGQKVMLDKDLAGL